MSMYGSEEGYGSEAGYGLFLLGNVGQMFANRLAIREGRSKEEALFYAGGRALSYENDYDSWCAEYLVNNDAVNDDTDGNAYFIYAEKQGGATKDADLYNSLDEMADEFRKKFGDCLPQNFNYKLSLCFFRASYSC